VNRSGLARDRAAMRKLVAAKRNCRVDSASRTVWLSKIFAWFEKDLVTFEQDRGRLPRASSNT